MNPVDRNRELAVLLQLLRRAREAESAAQLGFIMVNETRQLLDYRQAALWHDGPHGHVGALSGLIEPDPTAPYLQWLDRLFSHLGRQAGEPCRPLTAAAVPPALADEWANWLPAHLLWLRLEGAGALLLGADLVARSALSAGELPIGVITASVGAPLFIYLLLRQDANATA